MQDSDGIATLASLPEWQRCSRRFHYSPSTSLVDALQRDAQLTNAAGRHTKFFRPTPPQENFCMGVGTDNGGARGLDRGQRETGHGTDQSDVVTLVPSTRL